MQFEYYVEEKFKVNKYNTQNIDTVNNNKDQ